MLAALLLLSCGAPDPQPVAIGPSAPTHTLQLDDGGLRAHGDRVEARHVASGLSLGVEPAVSWLTTARGERVGLRIVGGASQPASIGPCPEGSPRGCAHAALAARGRGVQEWWVPAPEGFQQGFRVEDPADTVSIVLDVVGAVAQPDGEDAARLLTPDGETLRYEGLVAFDADGRSLPARLDVTPERVTLIADARGAVFPVTLDPIVRSDWVVRETGKAAAVAFDFNGDGYDDLAVADPNDNKGASDDNGTAFVYLGSASGVSGTSGWNYQNGTADGYMGDAIATGDVDGDGIGDIAVSTVRYSSWTGRVFVFLGDSASLPTSPSSTFTGSTTYGYFGTTLSMGDVDGDGYDDMIVGDGDDYVRLYWGTSSGLTTTGAWTYTSTAGTGYATAAAGDFDDDGTNELVLGFPSYTFGQSYEGALALFENSGSTVDSTYTWLWDSDRTSAACGRPLVTGDFDGDGVPDVAASCQGMTNGRVVVFYGGAGGLASAPDLTLDGTVSGQGFGDTLASAGDMDGDGDDELLVGSPDAGGGVGRVDLFLGDPAGLSDTAAGSATGNSDIAPLGIAVAGGGDLDGDGFDDVAVTTYESTYEYSEYWTSGSTEVFYGSEEPDLNASHAEDFTYHGANDMGTSLTIACDVNGDGFDDVVAGAYSSSVSPSGSIVWAPGSATGPALSSYATVISSGSWDRMVCAGDVNGDGYDDVAAQSRRTTTSNVVVLYGSATGLKSTSSSAYTYLGGGTGTSYGDALAGGLDVDGDGYDDLLVGEPGYAGSYYAEGRIVLYRGSASGIGTGATVATGGEDSAGLGGQLSPAGDVNGDGYDDLLASASGWDGSGSYFDQGIAALYLGSATGLASTAAWSVEGGSTSAAIAFVAGGSDLDGDGHLDAVVDGATKDTLDVFLGDGTTFATTPSATITGIEDSYRATAAYLADQTGDGRPELLVGSYTAGGDSESGIAWILAGSAAGLDGEAVWQMTGGYESAFFGSAVSAGDVNGDGFDDWAVGSPGVERVDIWIGEGVDSDEDGYGIARDCDDTDATVNPGAVEACDGVDNDCSGVLDDDAPTWARDADADGYGDGSITTTSCTAPSGYVSDTTDCDDGDAGDHPGATESCDGDDDDCDGSADEAGAAGEATWYRDADGDGHGTTAGSKVSCSAPSGYGATSDDCDDTRSAVHPGATESCDGLDDDCDGTTDEAGAAGEKSWYDDRDADGYGDDATAIVACDAPAGAVSVGGDCDDGDDAVSPSATERCGGGDEDCDGTVDEIGASGGSTYYADADADGYGATSSAVSACSLPAGYASAAGDCDDTTSAISPAATETCGGGDEDCDGSIDEEGASGSLPFYADADDDGYGDETASVSACAPPSGYVSAAGDCDDTDETVSPAGTETCGGGDEDCDGSVDEGDAAPSTWHRDLDRDGYGDDEITVVDCDAPDGYVAQGGDCDDTRSGTNPDAGEICGGGDEDCDGAADEPGAEGESTFWTDGDGDGYGSARDPLTACDAPTGFVGNDDDCDDDDAEAFPGATEVPADGIDQDCDGADATVDPGDTDEGTPGPGGDDEGKATGCACDSGSSRASFAGGALLLAALFVRRRR